ncbi:hypothetical protein Vretimale_7495 [Volvox reticuliferus]|uniref:Uncharacterized protein n=1 Tax=Volvox reticuliferus TaxID=1737510 RepID=A0A8J4FIS7_9CHLO|nr:hypothetical protein Vretifemale_7518 [Volvox reticuliferus]GIM02617.1 hypothetical protein Vretimale_7495 [Volvox reticuliferus]
MIRFQGPYVAESTPEESSAAKPGGSSLQQPCGRIGMRGGMGANIRELGRAAPATGVVQGHAASAAKVQHGSRKQKPPMAMDPHEDEDERRVVVEELTVAALLQMRFCILTLSNTLRR